MTVKAFKAFVTIGFILGCFFLPAQAQTQNRCTVLCVPELKLEPTVTVENLVGRPRIAELENGVAVRTAKAEREAVFEIILAVDIPTEIPRVGLTVEAIWAPFETGLENPFTGATADQLGKQKIRDNPVELEFELNLTILEAERSRGWVESHFDVVDKFSPAERPGDTATYTHKLNFELDTAFFIFNWLGKGNWLRNIEAEISLDYLATGLPKAGDVLGDELFLDDASPWSLSLVFVVPIAPLSP